MFTWFYVSSVFRFFTGNARDIARQIVDAATQLQNSPYSVVAEDQATGWYILSYQDPDGKSVNNAYIFIGPGIWRIPHTLGTTSAHARFGATYGVFILVVRQEAVDVQNWAINESPQIFALHPIYSTADSDTPRCGDVAQQKLQEVMQNSDNHPAKAYLYVDARQITLATEPAGETTYYGLPWLTHLLKWPQNLNPNLQRPVPLPHWALWNDGTNIIMVYGYADCFWYETADYDYVRQVRRLYLCDLSRDVNGVRAPYNIIARATEAFHFEQRFSNTIDQASQLCQNDPSEPIYGAPGALNQSIYQLVSNRVPVGPMRGRYGSLVDYYNAVSPLDAPFYSVWADHILNIRGVVEFYQATAMGAYAARALSDGNAYLVFPAVTDEALSGFHYFVEPGIFLGLLDIVPVAPRNSNLVHGDVVQLPDGRQYIVVNLPMHTNVANLSVCETVYITYPNYWGDTLRRSACRSSKYAMTWLIRYA